MDFQDQNSTPKRRLQLKPKLDQPISEVGNKKEPEVPKQRSSLKLNLPPRPQDEKTDEKSHVAPEPAPDSQVSPTESEEFTIDKTPPKEKAAENTSALLETETNERKEHYPPSEEKPSGQRKTSPLYYLLLLLAIISSVYVLFKDKWTTLEGPSTDSATLSSPFDGASPKAPELNERSDAPARLDLQLPSEKLSSNVAEAVQTRLTESPPLRMESPPGILIEGVFFSVGSILIVEPVEIRLSEIRQVGPSWHAIFTFKDEAFHIPLR